MTIVNLNKFRKAKAKVDKKSSASIHRIKFGRSKAEKAKEKHAEKKRNELLDGVRREDQMNAKVKLVIPCPDSFDHPDQEHSLKFA